MGLKALRRMNFGTLSIKYLSLSLQPSLNLALAVSAWTLTPTLALSIASTSVFEGLLNHTRN